MLTFKKLAPALAAKHRLTQKEADAILGTVRDLIEQTLVQGEDLHIGDIGRLMHSKRKARTGRNPQTGAALVIEAANVLKFKPSSVLLAKLNAK